MPLLLAFLKMLGAAAAKGAVGLGKAALTGAKLGAKGALALGKGVGKLTAEGLKKTEAGKLLSAFSGMMKQPVQQTAEVGGMGQVPIAPPDYYQTPQAQIQPTQQLPTGLFSPTSAYAGETQPQIQPPTIPEQYRGFGQTQPVTQQLTPQVEQQYPQPGFIRGFTENLLGMPQTPALQEATTGRKTAYYAGGLIPNIIMSKLGQPSAIEAAGQQALLTQRQNLAGQPVIDPETGQILYTRPKGAVFRPELPEEKQQRAIETAQEKAKIPTADIRNLAKQADMQLLNIETLEKEAQPLPGGYEGITARATAIATRGGQFGNVYMYERKIPAIAAGLYRALTGDNRLSDMDAQQRALPLLWNTSIDTSLKKPMFDFLKNAFKVRKRLLEQGSYNVDPTTNQPILDWQTILTEAKSQQPQQTEDLEYQKYLQAIGGQ